MINSTSDPQWLTDRNATVDGLVSVHNYESIINNLQPEEVVIMEKARHYGASAVFFQASPNSNVTSIAQAFIYHSDGPTDDPEFGNLHRKLWSWGGVPIVYRVTSGLVQLFRCAHKPEFEKGEETICKPFDKINLINLATEIASSPWWDSERLRNGTLWDDPNVCENLLSKENSAQKALIKSIEKLYEDLETESQLPRKIQRRLLILSVLIAYLEARSVFEDGFFARFRNDAGKFFQVLADGSALVNLLGSLEQRFNGHVFTLSDDERKILSTSSDLAHFASFIESRQEQNGQRTLWERYSFADLPVEVISHIYQLFVEDDSVAVYTPHFAVRMMLGEVLSWDRLDRLEADDEVILDGACGSGIFLVEAYKRLVLHWRYRHGWEHPTQAVLQKLLTARVRGVDVEEAAVELAAFSLCLALCDALEPMAIRNSVRLFPELKEVTIHTDCFFAAIETRKITERVGVIVGNPPFVSELRTESAKRAYECYRKDHGVSPDKQLAYLFLHKAMEILVPGGILSMLQPHGFLYNQKSQGFRQKFIECWDLREILDFISIRGLFQRGDTKAVVIVAEKQLPPLNRQILHAVFRRSGRTDAEQGFDIDFYDMHWLSRDLVLQNDSIWRSNLFGGGRVLGFVDRLKKFKTLKQYALDQGWDFGEGWIEGETGKRVSADHITGKNYIPSEGITVDGINKTKIQPVIATLFKTSYNFKRFTPPMLLIREHKDIPSGLWTENYLTYKDKVVGFCAPESQLNELEELDEWISKQRLIFKAYIALISKQLFAGKATAILSADIMSLPCPTSEELNISPHEEILVHDIMAYYCDLIRLGEDSDAMKNPGTPALHSFNEIFADRISGVYQKNQLRPLDPQVWQGVICQPYVFGMGSVDWSGADELKEKIDNLLREKRGGGINVTRIARLYDGAFIYLIKPDRLRYWLKSVALRDADETLADLSDQGF